jgi:predicted small secreted protein
MKPFLIALIGLFLPLLAACNTMQGFGKDVKTGGEAIEKSASKNK